MSHKEGRSILFLPGKSELVEYGLMGYLWDGLNLDTSNNSHRLNFDFQLQDKNNSPSSGLVAEKKQLRKLISESGANRTNLTVVAKSFSSIVAAGVLNESKYNCKDTRFIILGFPAKYLTIEQFKGSLVIVQGTDDRYGNLDSIKQNLNGCSKLHLYSIIGGNHSFETTTGNKWDQVQDIVAKYLQ